MTVSYHLHLASVSSLTFLHVLFRWKGSVWKQIYKELLVWITTFLIISLFYRYLLSNQHKTIFEKLIKYFNDRLNYIPTTFILGFFVHIILSRWSAIFHNMGYIESYALFTSNYISGTDLESKVLRETIARYMCLTQVLVFRDISISVRKRFPNIDSIINAGIITVEEKKILDIIKLQYNKYWVPIRWIHNIAQVARDQQRITNDIMYCKLLNQFRHDLQLLCNYDWVPLPLVYTQAVFLAIYVYFFVCLLSRQFISNNEVSFFKLDLIIPIMTTIQFIFYTGWLKIAQALINPFGDDDDDFECNYLIDKNITVRYYYNYDYTVKRLSFLQTCNSNNRHSCANTTCILFN
ncbi:unnamed protein product [Thelazia callipaeda]|uniref:Bestrophin homolog n=1 Tax=Thelazia callipaeda TaxID=103827 RepID=A0A0N5CW58_THECL|nr:unnamed protein product [Thelazia callipaeda]